jgi:hypothetical protein
MLTVNRNPSSAELRRFARLWLPLAVLLLGAVAGHRTHSSGTALAVWSVGGGLAVLTAFSLRSARALFVALSYVSFPIGFAVSFLILATVYFVMITPLGVARRLSGQDTLHLKPPVGESAWRKREGDDDARAFRQF